MSWGCIGCGIAIDVFENPITGVLQPLCYDCAEQQQIQATMAAYVDTHRRAQRFYADMARLLPAFQHQRITAAKRRARAVTRAKGSKQP